MEYRSHRMCHWQIGLVSYKELLDHTCAIDFSFVTCCGNSTTGVPSQTWSCFHDCGKSNGQAWPHFWYSEWLMGQFRHARFVLSAQTTNDCLHWRLASIKEYAKKVYPCFSNYYFWLHSNIRQRQIMHSRMWICLQLHFTFRYLELKHSLPQFCI